MAKSSEEKQATVDQPAFTKEALLHSQKYAENRDVLSALLVDGQGYTFSELDEIIEKFQKGKVK